ncbi:hypothetical protein [Kribbella sp. NPDC004875]|uniref:hypothetical protein n=1 Tax=Kribbella sp. NPDC004875 TaxID=3364107 RepID=UPI0036BAD65C
MPEVDQPELLEGELLLDVGDEKLWRNVNPAFFDGDQMTTQAFTPTKKDEGKLSSAMAALVTAEEHFREFTEDLGLQSSGVWCVTVDEVAGTGLRAVYDCESPERPDPCPKGHAYVDFRGAGSGLKKRAATKLRDAATNTGRVHP